MTFSRLFLLTLIFILSGACATSPTGRKQLMLVPDDQMNIMGAQSFQTMKMQSTLETDEATNEYVKCVAYALISGNADRLPQKGWEIVTFRSDQVNAFALPGSKIGVYTGLLEVAKTPAQLAAVLGHEVGHVLARHGNERVSAGLATQGALIVASEALKTAKNRNLIMGALGVGTQFGILLPHSRVQESEADAIGLDLMAHAGFNPQESVALWQNMSLAGGGQPPEWMSTHPSNDTRIRDLKEKVPNFTAVYNTNKNRDQVLACRVP